MGFVAGSSISDVKALLMAAMMRPGKHCCKLTRSASGEVIVCATFTVKSFAGAARAVLVILLIASCATTDAQPNQVIGTCQDLTLWGPTVGVEDAQGTRHPDYYGWTLPNFGASITYSKIGETSSLKGVCAHALAHVQLLAKPLTSLTDWIPVPPSCNSCGCNLEKDDWEKRLAAHELVHAQDAIAEAAKCSASLPRFISVHACAKTQSGLKKALDAQVSAKIISCAKKAARAWDVAGTAFDNSPAGKVPLPDCTKCLQCAPGQQPYCAKPCGGLVNGVYANCGLSSSKQPVACCQTSATDPTPICSPLGTSACP